MRKHKLRPALLPALLVVLFVAFAPAAMAQSATPATVVSPAPTAGVSSVINPAGTLPSVSLGGFDLGESGDLLEILFGLTILALLPSILIMTTSFTRIVIVLSCLRNAIGLQQTPLGPALAATLRVGRAPRR